MRALIAAAMILAGVGCYRSRTEVVEAEDLLCEARRLRASDVSLNGDDPVAVFGDTGTPVYLLEVGELVANVEGSAYNAFRRTACTR